MTYPRTCCKNCENRHLYCHCDCDEYKAYKIELSEIKEHLDTERNLDDYERENYKKRRWNR